MSNDSSLEEFNVPSHEQYLKERNLQTYPEDALNELFNIESFRELRQPFQNYINSLRDLIDKPSLIIAAHGLVSHLLILLENQNEHLAQLLLPSEIDTYTTQDPHDTRLLIASWERQQIDATSKFVTDVADKISRGQPPVSPIFIYGSMYSDKSGNILRILREVFEHPTDPQVEGLIARALQESAIKTREGGRPNTPLETTIQLPADQVDEANILPTLNSLESKLNKGDVLVIDEISFISFDEKQIEQIIQYLTALTEKGVHVITAGLDTDYRAIELPFYKKILETSGVQFAERNAYYSYYGKDYKIHYGNKKTCTSRIDLRYGFVDLFLPVVVPRVLNRVGYKPAPPEGHIFSNLKQNDPDLFDELISKGGQEDLLNFTTDM